MPVGARGFVRNSWPEGGGHILVWEKTGDRVVFHDPQTGRVNIPTSKYLNGYAEVSDGEIWVFSPIKPGSLMVVRIDDSDPVDGVLDVIGGDLEQWR